MGERLIAETRSESDNVEDDELWYACRGRLVADALGERSIAGGKGGMGLFVSISVLLESVLRLRGVAVSEEDKLVDVATVNRDAEDEKNDG